MMALALVKLPTFSSSLAAKSHRGMDLGHFFICRGVKKIYEMMMTMKMMMIKDVDKVTTYKVMEKSGLSEMSVRPIGLKSVLAH